jgi:hypothetical protein
LNPLFPFHNFDEFKRFFVARYAAETAAHGPYTDSAIAARIDQLAEEAQLHATPHLQLLVDWLYGSGSEIPDLQSRIDGWFARLHDRHPENPFILVCWGDAIKIPARLGLRPELKPGPDDRLPLEIIDAAIQKYEAAYTHAPDIDIISTKIAFNNWVTAHYFSKRSLDYRARMKKFEQFSARARLHLTDNVPNFDRDDLDWSKYGLTNELVDELMKYVAEEKKKK